MKVVKYYFKNALEQLLNSNVIYYGHNKDIHAIKWKNLYLFIYAFRDLTPMEAVKLLLEHAQKLIENGFNIEKTEFGWKEIYNIKNDNAGFDGTIYSILVNKPTDSIKDLVSIKYIPLKVFKPIINVIPGP